MKKIELKIISIHILDSPQAMPLAAAMLKAQLDSIQEIAEKINVSFTDYYLGSTAETIAEDICRSSPDIIGFSTYLWNRNLTEEICHIVRKTLPPAVLFAGGAEATALPEDLLSSAPFDFVIKGEGELALTETVKRILDNKTYDDVDGVFVKGNADGSGENQQPVINLDSIPSPFLTGTIDSANYEGALWELSRGCPFKCTFCFESRGVSGVRQFSLERLRKELELFESKKTNQIFVLDPTFNCDVIRAKKILHMILETAPQIHFTFEARTEFLDAETAELFAMINCSLQIGLQSAIPEVLSNVNRKIDPDKYADQISLLNSAGVIFGLDLIYGLPGDTIKGFKHSLNYALMLQPNLLEIFPLSVLPGTVLYDQAESFSLNCMSHAPYSLISSPGFSGEAMNEAKELKNACDIFYNKGSAAGWMFMILETLDIAPSDFLEDFAVYIAEDEVKTKLDKNQITHVQSSFVEELFKKHGIENLFPVMNDIIMFHGAVNDSLYEGPYSGEIKTEYTGDSVIMKSQGTKFIKLSYNFDDLMTVGEVTLEEFIFSFNPETTWVIIYNKDGEIKPLIINRDLSRLIQAIDNSRLMKEIIDENSHPEAGETDDFIAYALSETIIYIK